MQPLALFPLLAPLSLVLASIAAHRDAGQRPRRALRATRIAMVVGLVVAVATAIIAATLGPLVSPLLGAVGLGFSVRVDGLSAAMFCLVAGLGAAVLQFSRNYLDGDERQGVFLGDLALTVGCVMLVVLSGNLVQLAIMWSATSIALHRLLLFYPARRGAVVAARKKFIVARAGDACLVAASVILVRAFGTGDIGALLEGARGMAERGPVPFAIHAAAVLVVMTAALKAAQFPAHGWLVEMQETPTPVSALLHAGILNGGTFLVVRLAGVVQLSSPALAALIVVGGFSALFASVVMVTESRIKTSYAYSSAAHMGFMFLLCGIGAYSVAIVHLLGHSFYKAHAFLSSGSAVDTQRAARPTADGVNVRAAALLCSFPLAGAMVFAVGTVMGVRVLADATSVALAAVLTLGLGHLIGQSARGALSARVIGTTALAAVATAVSFFALERFGVFALGGAIPAAPASAPAALGLTIAALSVFALVSVVQALLPALTASPVAARAYVLARNGLYANAYFDRLVGAAKIAERTSTRPPRAIGARRAIATAVLGRALVDASLSRVTRGFAPVWPLERFVAVNPFLGLAHVSFARAAQTMARVAGARMTMPRRFYGDAIASGRIAPAHLAQALAEGRAEGLPGLPADPARLAELARVRGEEMPPQMAPTVADVLSARSAIDWNQIMMERVGAWAAAYFDEGQASWPSPWRGLPAFEAWRAEAALDATPEVLGARDFRGLVARLPTEARPTVEVALARLGVSAVGLDTYLQRLLHSTGGWAAYARHIDWDRELRGEKGNDTLEQILAIRLAWEVILLDAFADDGAEEAWGTAREALDARTEPATPDLAVDLVLQAAFEKGWQQSLIGKLAATKKPGPSRAHPLVQAAFCIDVRSEVYRRALEAADPESETLGFAGFFGVAVEYVALGEERGIAQCPVLLTTTCTVTESVTGACASDPDACVATRLRRRRARSAWRAFKSGAVACFSFVGPVGLAYAPKLLLDGLGLTRSVPHPSRVDVDASVQLGPSLAPRTHGGRPIGLSEEQRAAMAEGLLRGMSLTADFARVVMLVGHGSTTVNNPHAAGLDCGACGGHSGEANARIAAAVLNEPRVRAALSKRGIDIPDATVFLGCLHDTTTDQVVVFDQHLVPASHREDLARLEAKLADASGRARGMRAPRLRERTDAGGNTALLARSRDWAQVRPEWGLAGCAAFIVAPRRQTASIDLEGRSFLHSYDWRADADFGVLELIMTAPMVVASWISLQYYASTVDNRVFGCGNKVLHNVVGTVGVLEGNGGDLRVGLPWQSVHDGERLLHEPVRLDVVIEAPIEAMNTILDKHPSVRALVDNGWLRLHALGEAGAITHRYTGNLVWEALEPSDVDAAA